MRPKLSIILVLIVLVPTALLIGFGIRLAGHEQVNTRERFESLLNDRLGDVDQGIAQVLDNWETRLLRLFELPDNSSSQLKRIAITSPLLEQTFALDAEGQLLYPTYNNQSTSTELDFLERVNEVLLRKDFVMQSEGGESPKTHSWLSWFWGSDIRLLFWMLDAEGRTIGGEVDKVILTSDIINSLPHTQSELDLSSENNVDTRIRLVNSRLEVIYQWGSYEVPEGSSPISTRSLSSPLSAWSLQLFQNTDPLESVGTSILLTIIVSTLALGLVLAGLGVYFYREYSRDINEASQRVSFVNQVSHELKTPLTNIRLYTELLSKRLNVGDSKAAEYAEIIVSENQRLSRLIGNVLSFGRKERDKLILNRTQGQVDEQIVNVLESYKPALVATGIELDVDLNADHLVLLDGDVIGQVLGNLLSNVEKYAVSGSYLRIESRRVGEITTISVSDKGPGVPQSETENIFEPFYRIDNRLSEGISGTGIGLSIARDLARLHGGDLQLLPSTLGASFEITLLTPSIDEENLS